MSEEKSNNDKDKNKPDMMLLGAHKSSRTALIESIIEKWENKTGIEVKTWIPKDRPLTASVPMLILDDYKQLMPMPKDLPLLPITLPDNRSSNVPIKSLNEVFEARMKDYTKDYMISSPLKSEEKQRGTNKTPKKKKRVKNKRK